MQNAGEEGGGGGGETRPQGAVDNMDGGDGEAVAPAQEGASQDHSGPGPGDPALPSQSGLTSGDEDSPGSRNLELETAAQAAVTPPLSNLISPELMEDQELPEEEFSVLHADHPLVQRQQAALTNLLSKHLERLNLGLKEKHLVMKEDTACLDHLFFEMHRVQMQLGGAHVRLDNRHESRAQAEARRRQTQDQLEVMKSQHSSDSSQDSKARANVSRLQAEIDNLLLHLVFTQKVSDELRSDVKSAATATRKAEAERTQAEEEKLKQDMYVERLTKDEERLTQQIDMYHAQISEQTEETRAARDAFAEADLEMESLVVARKQLLQQWNSSLVGMRRRDEAVSAMQEAVRTVSHQVILLDREIDSYKKSTSEEQEQNETLTAQLNWFQMDGAATRRLVGQKQGQQEALQAEYSACLRTLRETENTLARLTKEVSGHQAEVSYQRRQLEKESAARLDLENQIVSHMQQKLTHNKAAKYSQRLSTRVAELKKEKISQLGQLESEVTTARLESGVIGQRLDSLALAREVLDEEVAKYNALLSSNQAQISSFVTLIGQKQTSITKYNKKIHQITSSTGHEDLSPLHIKANALMDQIEELAAEIRSERQLWMKRQGTLVGLTQEIQANGRDMLKLQTECTSMRQKKIRLESQVEVEHREQAELERSMKTVKGDLVKLNTLLSRNGQLSQALEQENALMETGFLHRLKDAERESVEMQMKQEKTQEEKERLLNSLVEAERQIMLWEKKTQLVKETRSAVASGMEDNRAMKVEIHRMEVRLGELTRQQEQLLRESEDTVARRETIMFRREALVQNAHRQTTKAELSRLLQGLQRKIQETTKHVAECEQVIVDLQQAQTSLSERLTQQKKWLIELCGAGYVLDPDFVNLQDAKERNLAHLVALQGRTRKLQGVCEGSYQPCSSSEAVGGALQGQAQRVHAASSIVHHVCEEFPQHQGALRRVALTLAARKQALDQDQV